jgi:hypothetical protein
VTAIYISPINEKPPSAWSGWWLILNLRVFAELARRPLLWRRNMNNPNNSVGDANWHRVARAEASHGALHANVRIRTE